MESLKAWAKGVYLVAVISSAALVLIPKSMQKQSKFVIELLLLLCILAPVAGFVGKPQQVAGLRLGQDTWEADGFSLERFYALEVQRRVTQLALAAGLPIHSVQVEPAGVAPEFSATKLTLYLTVSLYEPDGEVLQKFRELIATQLDIDPGSIRFEGFQE